MLTTKNKTELRAFIKKNHSYMSANVIAEKFGTGGTTVRRYAEQMDITFERVQPNQYDVSQYDHFIKDNWESLGIVDIARELDVSQKYVWKIAARMGLPSKGDIVQKEREEMTLLLYISKINEGKLTAKKAGALLDMHLSKVKKLLASVNKCEEAPFNETELRVIRKRVVDKLRNKSMAMRDIKTLIN